MKVKILTAISAACIAICVVFAAGCGNGKLEKQVEELQQQVDELTEEKAELSSQTEQLQQQLADLKEQNVLTEEQLSELQQKAEKFLDLPWHYEPGYVLYMFDVVIKPEYNDREYTIEDFLPARLSRVEKMSYFGDNWYRLYIDEEGTDSDYALMAYRFFSAVIAISGFEFVDYIYLITNGQGT